MFSCHITSEILTTAFYLPCKLLGERAYFFKALLNLHLPARLYLKGYRAPVPRSCCFTVCVLSPVPWVCMRLVVWSVSSLFWWAIYCWTRASWGCSNLGFPLSLFMKGSQQFCFDWSCDWAVIEAPGLDEARPGPARGDKGGYFRGKNKCTGWSVR